VSDRVKRSFVIFDIRALWCSECPDVKNYKWQLNQVWHRMLYSCTHMTTVGVKGLMLSRWGQKWNTSVFKRCNGIIWRTQNSTLLLLPVPDNSASQSYLSSCNAQCLSSLFLNELTEGAVTTEKGRLFHTFVILMLNERFLGLWWLLQLAILIHCLSSSILWYYRYSGWDKSCHSFQTRLCMFQL